MPLYQLKTVIDDNKVAEFARCLNSLKTDFLQQEGCLEFHVTRDIEKVTTYCFIGEFDTLEAMKAHFQASNFKVLLGATQVLGQSFRLSIAKENINGGYELVNQMTTSSGGNLECHRLFSRISGGLDGT